MRHLRSSGRVGEDETNGQYSSNADGYGEYDWFVGHRSHVESQTAQIY